MPKLPRRVTAALAILLATLLLPVLTNYLSDFTVPGLLKSPWVVVPATLLFVVVVAYDQMSERFGGASGGLAEGESRLLSARLVKTTRQALKDLDRGSIDVEARSRLGSDARVPLTLRAEDDVSLTGRVIGPDELLESVVATRGGVKLALVGEPGSGKTTFLRDLARSLAADADLRSGTDDDYVVPVLVDAAAWPDRLPFVDHLREVVQLRNSVTRPAFDRWLAGGRLYLLVDNISWLPAPRRRSVIEELNAFRAGYPAAGILVGANEEMMRAQGATLDLRRVTIEPLSSAQVLARLEALRGTHSTLYQVALTSPVLVETMRTRLFFTAALLAFEDGGMDVAGRLRNPDAQGAIVGAYVDWLLSRRERAGIVAEPTAEGLDARRELLTKLGWVAAQLKRMQAGYFRDYLTVLWIPRRRLRRGVNLLLGALVGLVAALATAVIIVPRHETTGWWVSGAILALLVLVRLPDRSADEFKPARTTRARGRWSARAFRRGFFGPYGLISACGIAYGVYLLYQQLSHWSDLAPGQRRHALVLALIVVVGNGSLMYVQGLQLDMVDTPNWAVGPMPRPVFRFLVRSTRWALYGAVGGGAAYLLVRGTVRLLAHVLSGGRYPSYAAAVAALRPDVGPSLLVGGVVFTVVLVVLLGLLLEVTVVEGVLSDDPAVPEDLPALLDRAVRLSLVQRRGGNEYVFSHQILRDHLAGS